MKTGALIVAGLLIGASYNAHLQWPKPRSHAAVPELEPRGIGEVDNPTAHRTTGVWVGTMGPGTITMSIYQNEDGDVTGTYETQGIPGLQWGWVATVPLKCNEVYDGGGAWADPQPNIDPRVGRIDYMTRDGWKFSLIEHAIANTAFNKMEVTGKLAGCFDGLRSFTGVVEGESGKYPLEMRHVTFERAPMHGQTGVETH